MMNNLLNVILLSLITMATCHVTVFRNGRWQSVPGRRPISGAMDRFGYSGMPFAPMLNQGLNYNNNNMWLTPGFPQIPQNNLNNQGQWFSNDDENQSNLMDPWTQYTLLQGAGNPGTNGNPNTITGLQNTDINTLGPIANPPVINPNTGNQFTSFPNTDIGNGQFGQFQGMSNNGFGSSIINPNQGIGSPFVNPNQGIGSPFVNPSQGIGSPFVNPSQGIGSPFVNPSQGIGSPFINSNQGIGSPFMNPNQGMGSPFVSPNQGIGSQLSNLNQGIGSPLNGPNRGIPSGLSFSGSNNNNLGKRK